MARQVTNQSQPLNIPKRGKLSQGQIAALWVKEGGNIAKADEASAIAMAESGGEVESNSNPCCKGLYQINVSVGNSSLSCAMNEVCATKKAIEMSHNGQDWTPWESFTNGSYKKYLGKSGYQYKAGQCKPFGGSQLGSVAAGAVAGGTAGAVGGAPLGGVGALPGAGIGALLGAAGTFLGSNVLGGCSPTNTEHVNPLSGLDLVGKALEAIAKLFEDLFTAHFWVRAGKGLLGAVLLIYAINGMMKATLGMEIPLGKIATPAQMAIKSAAGKG